MQKPRVFIGSSVEGLNVAYAVQQNLLHEAEVTVWDQGVFELSRTTIESLTKALFDNDFAIFVFSPDDALRMRSLTAPSVRDNVLFEFGLFIGKLGRERVFFLLPSAGDLHIPNDLLGITPGRYESTRSDGSMQAATGAACHQIRLQIRALGQVPSRIPADASKDSTVADKTGMRSWIDDFIDKKYNGAKTALENELKGQSGEEALATRAWIIYCDLKERNIGTSDALMAFAHENADSSRVQSGVATILCLEGHLNQAVQLLSISHSRKPQDTVLALALARAHTEAGNVQHAVEVLQRAGADHVPDVAIALADTFERDDKKKEALETLERCYAAHPSHKDLRFKYARLAQDLNQHIVAMYLLEGLAKEDKGSVEYWGYLGNSCLDLNMYDVALRCYRRAEKLTKEDQSSQWIVANIGNLLTHKGLPTESRIYLEKALRHEPDSEYAHDRLAGAIKKQTEEQKEFQKKCGEGKRKVNEAAAKYLKLPEEKYAFVPAHPVKSQEQFPEASAGSP